MNSVATRGACEGSGVGSSTGVVAVDRRRANDARKDAAATEINPLTPEMDVVAHKTLSGSSSSSSFVDTTSSRSDGEVDDDERVRKNLNGIFAEMSVDSGPGMKTTSTRGNSALCRKMSASSDDEVNAIGKMIWRPNDKKEPILMDNDERFCLLPVKYHKAYEYYKMAQASYWTVEEVDLSQDKRDWDKLTKQEKHFISYVLAFFAASDGIVLENLAVRFMQGMLLGVVGGRLAASCTPQAARCT